MQYANLRLLHITCACLSVGWFSLRWALALRGFRWRQWRWLRLVPHANDTVLLAAAIGLAMGSHQYPWQQAWLGAKVLLLLLYIGLGKQALREVQSQRSRWFWGCSALTSVFFIATIAITRWPGGAL